MKENGLEIRKDIRALMVNMETRIKRQEARSKTKENREKNIHGFLATHWNKRQEAGQKKIERKIFLYSWLHIEKKARTRTKETRIEKKKDIRAFVVKKYIAEI